MEYDVVVVGAGPAGLAAAIRLKQLRPDASVCLVEKGAEVGSHILSGACIETRALEELFPDGRWRSEEGGAPLHTVARRDRMMLLTEKSAVPLPVIPQMDNVRNGNRIVSLGQLCKWLAAEAEEAGVDVFPGFAGSEVLYEEGSWSDAGDVIVRGVATGDFGIGKDGQPKPGLFQRGVELRAKHTIFAEGCRGSLTRQLYENPHLGLRKKEVSARTGAPPVDDPILGKMEQESDEVPPQTFALGLKEIWEIDPSVYEDGLVQHTVGWPLDSRTYGGSFLYHYEGNKMAVGFVVALDYENPTLSPYEEFQRFKTHPSIRHFFEGGTCIKYGARTLVEGGYQSLPNRLSFPGGVLVGDSAGFLNVPKIKGVHMAMKSGMLGAEAVARALEEDTAEAVTYSQLFQNSWLHDELYSVRNFRPYFSHFGLYGGLLMSGIDALILRGKAPWTLNHKHADHEATLPLDKVTPIVYPKPDGKITFDLLTNLARSGTNHDHDQPAHLTLKDPNVPQEVNLKIYGGPEQYFCPARVYEYVEDDKQEAEPGQPRPKKLQINAQNCLHCKACDIKDPRQNIVWTVPQGGEGPSYDTM